MNEEIKASIRAIVANIPEGKVMTYGDVAKMAGIKDVRIVGKAISGNTDPAIPCHRLVKADGSLALNYSKGDWTEDKRKLLSEGVKFVNEHKVDLSKYQYKINS